MSVDKIPLTQGKFALVSKDDYERLSAFKWHVDNKGYARRNIIVGGRRWYEYIHQVVNKTPKGFDTDHINRDKLDNRPSNLRTVTRSQNQHNRGKLASNKSGYKGVSYSPNTTNRVWRAQVMLMKKVTYLGMYETPEEASAVCESFRHKHNLGVTV